MYTLCVHAYMYGVCSTVSVLAGKILVSLWILWAYHSDMLGRDAEMLCDYKYEHHKREVQDFRGSQVLQASWMLKAER